MSVAGLLGAVPRVNDMAMYSKSHHQTYPGGYQKGKRTYTSPYNPNAFCDHCNLKGHYKVDRYKLIGYPPGHPKHGDQKGGIETDRYKQRRLTSAHSVMFDESEPQDVV